MTKIPLLCSFTKFYCFILFRMQKYECRRKLRVKPFQNLKPNHSNTTHLTPIQIYFFLLPKPLQATTKSNSLKLQCTFKIGYLRFWKENSVPLLPDPPIRLGYMSTKWWRLVSVFSISKPMTSVHVAIQSENLVINLQQICFFKKTI